MAEPPTVKAPPKAAPVPFLPPLSPAAMPVRLARAVLLFFRGGPWTPEDHTEWAANTGTPLCTTKNLCDMARQVEAGMASALATARLQALREAEAACTQGGMPDAASAVRRLREGMSHGTDG